MAVIDNDWKLISQVKRQKKKLELYNLNKDPSESNNLLMFEDYQIKRLNKILEDLRISIDKSVNGEDYPSGKVSSQPSRIFWTELPEYKKFFQEWKDRPEFKFRLNKF